MTKTDIPTIDVANFEAFAGQGWSTWAQPSVGCCCTSAIGWVCTKPRAGPVTWATSAQRTGTTERYVRNGSATRKPDPLFADLERHPYSSE